ncbi:1093_t:CDS:2, partial [Racocetra persica]
IGALASVSTSIASIVNHGTPSSCIECGYYDYGYFYVNLIFHAIIFLVTAFGIIVVCCAESPALLRSKFYDYCNEHAKTQNDIMACDDAYRSFTIGSI